MITLSQDFYWNSKQNIPLTSRMNLKDGNFLKQIWIGLCQEMYFLNTRRRVVKNFDSKIYAIIYFC
jgi:hypothetical protein